MRQLKIALVLAAVVLSGCGVWNDLFGSKQSASMQPVCSRAALEVIIARAGMACSDTNPCPSGSYCNAGAVCAWSCYADSECATGQFCGCDGRCTGSSSGADGGTSTTNLSCNKDATLLYKIKPGSSPVNIPPDACDSAGHCPLGAQCDTTSNTCNWVRACDNDERCPAGSYCDPATGNCGWDCQPNVACPDAAQTCDCTGRCVVPGTTPTMGQSACQPRQTVTMGVAPRTSFLAGDPAVANSWTRTVELTLSASDPSFLVGRIGLQPVTQTYVVPRDNLQVLCNGAFTSSPCPLPRNGGPPGSTDSWDIETLTPTPGSMMARATIQLQFQGTPGVVAPSWHADVFTPGASNSPQALDFAFNTKIQNLPGSAPNWQTGPLPDGASYQGTMFLSGSTDTINTPPTTPAAVTPASLQVFAKTQGDQLYIFDPSRTISGSGTVVLTNEPGAEGSYYLVKRADPRMTLTVHGNTGSTIYSDPVSGGIKGQFFVDALTDQPDSVAAFAAFFSLTPIASNQPVPAIPTEPPADPLELNYSSNALWQGPYYGNALNAASSAHFVTSLWLNEPDLYSYTRGVSSPVHVSKPTELQAKFYLDVYPTNAGQDACNVAFLQDYVQNLNQQWTDSSGVLHQSKATPPFVDVLSMCQGAYTTQEQKDSWLPCVDGTGIESVLRASAPNFRNETASCQAFHDNQAFSRPAQHDYPTWLAQDCFRITTGSLAVQQIKVATNTTETNYSNTVYICPDFRRSLVRVPLGGYSTPAAIASDPSSTEAAYCYDPAHSGSTLLWSGRLTDGADAANTMEFSGDLLCQDDNNRSYAPKIFPLLDHADRVARGESFASSDASGSNLLDACVKELTDVPEALTQSDLSSTGIAQTLFDVFPDATCVSLPRFILALQDVTQYFAAPTTRDLKLFSHLLKQWIEVHSFVSYQGLQEAKLRRVLASATDATTPSPALATSGPDPGALPPIRYEDLLDLVDQSWEPLLSTYAYRRSLLLSVVNSPDYRDWSGSLSVYSVYPERQAHQDQWLPLPVVMVEGLNQQLRLLAAYLGQAALETYSADPTATNAARDQALVRAGATLRLVYLVEAVAQNLFDNIQSPAVEDRWQLAIGELHGLREDVRRATSQLSRSQNPLGIEENDLPIFFGDPQGTNSQYFASSDYLVSQWAIPSVATAEASIASARDAWLQARNSKIQDRMTQTQRDQRVNDISAAHGQKLVDNCGLTGIDSQDVLDAFEGGTPDGTKLQLGTCFIAPSCLARAGVTPALLSSKLTPRQIQFRLCGLNETAGYRTLQEPMKSCAAAYAGATISSLQAGGCAAADLYEDFNTGLVPDDALTQANLVCQARLGFRAPLPSTEALVGAMDPSCFRGKMGAQALLISAAKQDVDIARQNWDVAEQSFRLDVANCEAVEVAEDGAIQRAQDLKLALDHDAVAKEMAQESSDSWSEFSNLSFNPLSDIGGIFLRAHQDNAIEAQDRMDAEQRAYNEAMAIKQANDTIRACWHNVDKSQLAIVSAFAQIARRMTDATNAANQLNTMMNENLQEVRQGSNDVKREKNRYVSTVAHHYWVSEKVDKFNKDFDWAKRMTYLAMRAVEYEFQQSLPLRQAVLTASHPDQLQDAIRALQQEVGTRTINRRRPSESSIVLSLRDDVLALPDHSTDPTGERQLTPTRGLQTRLTDPRFAVHDKNGDWLGQGIPFNLGPEGALNYRCGERLWRITATVQGDALSDSQPGVSLLVLKRNTFASQWCEGEGDGTKFQYGSIQPSRRLFAENGTGTLESEANGFSTALIYPWFNIRRTDFYKDSYRDGASEELAGRGLYGDYILLFPRDVLEGSANSTDACVSVDHGFPLNQVEDVLIRFDYLSVDNLPDLQQ